MQRDYPPEIHAVNERARAAMKRGLALLEENIPVGLREAVQCFDEALRLRASLPLSEHCWIRYGLIAGWMNRGDALTRLGGTANLAEAVRNYDEALLQLRELPMNESPLFKKRLAIAWLNRGVTLQAQDTPVSRAQALQSFDEAITASQNLFSTGYAEILETLACAWMNRGNALLRSDPPQLQPARAAEQKSLTLLCDIEQENMKAGEMGLRSRHILCQALAGLIEHSHATHTSREELLGEASEIVDEGMALARRWEARGAKQFAALADDLFRFGCRIYQTHQPHFLTEFLLENLDPAHSAGAFAGNRTMHASAMESLWRGLHEIQRDGFKAINTPRFEKLLEALRELRIADERLAELRKLYAQA